MSVKAIAQLVQQQVANKDNYEFCGPDGKPDLEYFKKIVFDVSPEIKGLNYLVPHETFHPRIAVSIDFTHKFVQTKRTEDATRIVNTADLLENARKLRVFVKYYFEYIKSYNGKTDYVFTSDTASEGLGYEFDRNPADERLANEFINTVLNYFITSISVTRSRRQIGTATVTFKDTHDLKNGRLDSALFDHMSSIFYQLFCPMLPITIWAKGRLYRDWYFPIFDGYLVSVSPSDAAGFAELNLMCKDVLELARVSSEMINPALIQMAELDKVDAINLQSMPFYNHNHMDIIKRLFIGGPLEYSPRSEEESKNKFVNSFKQLAKKFQNIIDNIKAGIVRKTEGSTPGAINLMQLENFNFYNFSYDEPAENVFDKYRGFIKKEDFVIPNMLNYTSRIKTTRNVFAFGDDITPYRLWEIQGVPNFKSDFASRLDIISQTAKNVYYDFYVDGGGNVMYHPHRLGNDYLINSIIYKDTNNRTVKVPTIWPNAQVIGPEESFSHTSTLNLEEMVTFLRLTGQDPTLPKIESELGGIVGSAIDREHLNRFGYRRAEENNPMFNYNPSFDQGENKNKETGGLSFANLAAAVTLMYRNAELYTRESSIVFRPELELAAPVYFAEDNTVFYINSITHNISIGGSATTTINSSFGRKAEELPNDMYSFILQTEKLYKSSAKDSPNLEDLVKALPMYDWKRYLDDKTYNVYKNIVGKTTL